MEALIEQILDSPKLAMMVEQLNARLISEREKRAEFYAWLDEDKKAEFINGEVVCHSPSRFVHLNSSKLLLKLLDTHVEIRGLGWVAHERAMISLTRNDYEPDVCFWGREKASKFEPGQLRFPAPDFVVEILSESTEAVDRGVKFEDYAAHGVGEYWIVDPERETVEQYALKGEAYELLIKAREGRIVSRTVEGFTIPVRAIFDKAENLAALQELTGRPGGGVAP